MTKATVVSSVGVVKDKESWLGLNNTTFALVSKVYVVYESRRGGTDGRRLYVQN